MKQVNRTRRKAKQAERFASQAALCRSLPCCCCKRVPSEGHPIHPHHWPTVAGGGRDSDTSPLCFRCHGVFHDECGSAKEFERRTGVNVVLVAAELAERLKEEG